MNFIANMLAGECRMYVFFSHVLEEKQDRSRLHGAAARPLLSLLELP